MALIYLGTWILPGHRSLQANLCWAWEVGTSGKPGGAMGVQAAPLLHALPRGIQQQHTSATSRRNAAGPRSGTMSSRGQLSQSIKYLHTCTTCVLQCPAYMYYTHILHVLHLHYTYTPLSGTYIYYTCVIVSYYMCTTLSSIHIQIYQMYYTCTNYMALPCPTPVPRQEGWGMPAACPHYSGGRGV